MEFTSILDLRRRPNQDTSRPSFFVDLNLHQVVEKIQSLWGETVVPLYHYFPVDEECEEFRRAVYRDVKQEAVHQVLFHFYEAMKRRENARVKKEKVRSGLQKSSWQLRETAEYCYALQNLLMGLEGQELSSEGLQALREYLRGYLSGEAFRQLCGEVTELLAEQTQCRVTLIYDNQQILVSEEPTLPMYEDYLRNTGEQGKEFKSPFCRTDELTPLETEVWKLYARKHMDLFQRMEKFREKYSDYAEERLLLLAEELPFYLSFYKFEQWMKGKGFAFALPTCDSCKPMRAEGLYDLALAIVNLSGGKPVVDNSFYLDDGEQFFVLTGPNQGGKTTFARSLGQLVYFAKMGLSVPAKGANVPYFTGILTHFSVEESIETGRGKLKEELIRLLPMMEDGSRNSFVVINELFTTAANYDACIMGKNVLEHFIGLQCKGIYVTHLRELTECHQAVVSLAAMLDENRQQNFKVVRSKAETKGCAINQVNKYQLTYEQLKERLAR